ncbi:MAG TPA: hypothetical protein VHX88_11625 [Solirubrobacteraceae bacterium]|nr:hypothetical protein [Solirubrobacteraceae bacterium]
MQRRVLVQPPSGEPIDLRPLLKEHGLDRPGPMRLWFNGQVKDHLFGQFGFQRFAGYLNHESDEYSFSLSVEKDPTQLNYQELTAAVQRGLNTHILSKKVQTGHSSLGKVKLLARSGFPAAIKQSYDKAPVIQELRSSVGTNYAPKQIHLRHFVMGSWFRALPAVVAKADLKPGDLQALAKQVARLIGRVAPLAGVGSASSTGDLQGDLNLLAGLLHDLLPNLNAGSGPENTIIGFVSNGLSNLAEDVRKEKVAIARDDVDELVNAAIDGVNIVSTEEREQYKSGFDPGGVFTAIVDRLAGTADPVAPDTLSPALHEFAFQLGMDFMKHEVGKAQQMAHVPIAKLQALLFPLGQTLYGLILAAQHGPVSTVDLAKFFNVVEHAVGSFEDMLRKPN